MKKRLSIPRHFAEVLSALPRNRRPCLPSLPWRPLLVLVIISLAAAGARAQTCQLSGSSGGQSIAAQITIDNGNNTPVTNDMVVPAGTRLRLDAIATANGECHHVVTGTCGSCSCPSENVYKRTINHIVVRSDITTANTSGNYLEGNVFGRNPGGGTGFFNVLDTHSSNSTGPIYETLSAPGTYKYHFFAVIDTTICDLEPGTTEVVTITVHVREKNDAENNITFVPALYVPLDSVCGADEPPVNYPVTQVINRNGWSVTISGSLSDGLVLSDIRLNGRYMASSVSIPYYLLKTVNSTVPMRGELKQNSDDSQLRSRLVGYFLDDSKPTEFTIIAEYKIDRIPGAPNSCLTIGQVYRFVSEGLEPCEPSTTFLCSKWYPQVVYAGDSVASLNVVQRFHLRVNGYQRNTVGLFRDCDKSPYPPTLGCSRAGQIDAVEKIVVEEKLNPVYSEFNTRVITGGLNERKWDNIHQTYKDWVRPPGTFAGPAGCPECVHTHWRWGANVPDSGKYGNGLPLIPAFSHQDLEIGVSRYTGLSGDYDPLDYRTLINGEPIHDPALTMIDLTRNYDGETGRDIVFWYSATGHGDTDQFFKHGTFFGPRVPGAQKAIFRLPGDGGPLALTDYPTLIDIGSLFTDGEFSFRSILPTSVAPLPPGYTVYGNSGYFVDTDAEISGPHTLTFKAPSVTDSQVFGSLRVLQALRDPLDATRAVWVDRTGPSPDFATKTLNATTQGVGPFVLATFDESAASSSATTNLAVTAAHSPEPSTAGSNLTYTLNVTNNGTGAATEVTLANGLSPHVTFASAAATQGTCTEVDGNVYCQLGALAPGAQAVVTIVAEPSNDESIPAGGSTVTNIAYVRAKENDSDLTNNEVTESALVLPDPNKAPDVSITSPAVGQIFAGPANISVTASAGDPDGSIGKVDFYLNDTLAGTGTAAGNNQYNFTFNNVAAGEYTLRAAAYDNAGKPSASEPVNVFVNGPAAVSITSPATGSLFNTPVSLNVEATAGSAGGVTKVEFYANGRSIGEGVATAGNKYSLSWPAVASGDYSLTAVATDSSGVTSRSQPVKVVVNDPPQVTLVAPAGGSLFMPQTNITLSADARDPDKALRKVEFYANTQKVGTKNYVFGSEYNFTWNAVAPGRYKLKAVAIDNDGSVAISAPVNITVSAPPAVSLTSPANGAVFNTPAQLSLTAQATDDLGGVTKVEFFSNGNLLGAGAVTGTNQYGFNWGNAAAGTYSITAVATDDTGATTASSPSQVVVNTPPSVSITDPLRGAIFAPGSNVGLSVNVADGDGGVARVDYYAGQTLLGTSTAAPFSSTWANVAAGSYALTAVATDDRGAMTTSGAVTVAVNSTNSGIAGTVTRPDGTTPLAGAAVKVYSGATLLQSGTTDNGGYYLLAGFAPGAYTVEASAAGYEKQSRGGVAVTGGSTTTANFSLNFDGPFIESLSPTIGAPGTTVTLSGANFSTEAGGNSLKFNVTAGTVGSASANQITTAVPAGATSGRIKVTTPTGSGSSPVDFFVPPSPYTASDVEATGRMVTGGAKTVSITTAGKIGLILFDGSAGQRVSLKLSNVAVGSSSCCAARVSIFNPDGTQLVSPTYVGTSGTFIDTRSLAAAGTYAILIDPESNNTGGLTLNLYDVPPDATGGITPGGATVSVTTSTPGQNAKLTFAGAAGQRVSLKMTGVSIGTSGCCSTKVSLINPSGTNLISPTYVGTNGNFFDTKTLPAAGTYTVLVDPGGADAGGMTLTLYDVPADFSGTISPGGSSASVTTNAPGQNAQLTFNGTAGQRVSLKVSGVTIGTSGCCSANVSILNPDGSALLSPSYVGTGGGFFDTRTLPAAGTYKIVVDPVDEVVGGATLTIYDVPQDLAGTITPGGAAVTVTTTAPGQNARLTFTGAAGQKVSLKMSGVSIGTSGCCSTDVSLVNPNGTNLVSPSNVGTSGGFFDTKTLPADGTYTVFVNPDGPETGSMTLTLYDVPADSADTTTVGGTATTVATTVPGQNAKVTFDATAGQQVTVRLTNSTLGTVTVKLLKPDGSTQTTSTSYGSSSFNLTTQTLTTAGTYTVSIDPSGAVTGGISVRATSP